jgi:hypothetical protein
MSRYYVRMTDKFMSGWGVSEGKRNVLVVACDTWEQAAAIEKAAHDRSDMQRVEICLKPPRERSGVLYSRKHFSDFAGDWLAYYRDGVAA